MFDRIPILYIFYIILQFTIDKLHKNAASLHVIYVHILQNIQSNTIQLMVIIMINGIFYIITPSYMFRLSLFEPSSRWSITYLSHLQAEVLYIWAIFRLNCYIFEPSSAWSVLYLSHLQAELLYIWAIFNLKCSIFEPSSARSVLYLSHLQVELLYIWAIFSLKCSIFGPSSCWIVI